MIGTMNEGNEKSECVCGGGGEREGRGLWDLNCISLIAVGREGQQQI